MEKCWKVAAPTAGVKISSIRLLVIAFSHSLAQQQQRPFTLSKTNKGKIFMIEYNFVIYN
jgi:hypothetical protein